MCLCACSSPRAYVYYKLIFTNLLFCIPDLLYTRFCIKAKMLHTFLHYRIHWRVTEILEWLEWLSNICNCKHGVNFLFFGVPGTMPVRLRGDEDSCCFNVPLYTPTSFSVRVWKTELQDMLRERHQQHFAQAQASQPGTKKWHQVFLKTRSNDLHQASNATALCMRQVKGYWTHVSQCQTGRPGWVNNNNKRVCVQILRKTIQFR